MMDVPEVCCLTPFENVPAARLRLGRPCTAALEFNRCAIQTTKKKGASNHQYLDQFHHGELSTMVNDKLLWSLSQTPFGNCTSGGGEVGASLVPSPLIATDAQSKPLKTSELESLVFGRNLKPDPNLQFRIDTNYFPNMAPSARTLRLVYFLSLR